MVWESAVCTVPGEVHRNSTPADGCFMPLRHANLINCQIFHTEYLISGFYSGLNMINGKKENVPPFG